MCVCLACSQADGAAAKDVLECGVLEPFLVKYWGIKLATNAAITVLRVDQVCTQIRRELGRELISQWEF